MAEEIELKLALAPEAGRRLQRHPLLAQAERLPTRKLVNLYFDTPDLALLRHGIALRLRRQGRRWLQTVKCAAPAAGGLSRRPEWEQPYAGAFDFSAIDAPAVRRRLESRGVLPHLTPLFETTFMRRSWRVSAGRHVVLVMLDGGTIHADGRAEALCELELELAEGDTSALFDLARALAATVALRPESASKAERGYRLFQGAPLQPVKAGASPLRAEHTSLQAFNAYAAACLEQFQRNAAGAGGDPEFIHQMRVALRRLRSAMRLFRPILPTDFHETFAPRLRALAQVLGQARDHDVVLAEIVAPALCAFPHDAHLRALQTRAEAARQAARERALAAVADQECARLLLDLAAAVHAAPPPATPTQPDLPGLAARRLSRLRRRVKAAAVEARANADPATLHALRIAVKRLRYAIECFAPLYRRRAVDPSLARLTSLQERLGALNDLANAGPLLAACAADDPGLREAMALAGGWHGPRHAALLAGLPDELRELGKLRRFWQA